MRTTCSKGFSVFELIVALGIISIISASAVPATRAMRLSIERGEALHQLEFDLRRIRTEAVATGLLSVFRLNADGHTYSAGFDLLPYGSPPTIEETVFTSKLPNSVTVTSTAPVYFDSRGFLVNESSDPASTELILSSEGSTYSHIFVTPTGALDVYNHD